MEKKEKYEFYSELNIQVLKEKKISMFFNFEELFDV
jgi:hypothetical protein